LLVNIKISKYESWKKQREKKVFQQIPKKSFFPFEAAKTLAEKQLGRLLTIFLNGAFKFFISLIRKCFGGIE